MLSRLSLLSLLLLTACTQAPPPDCPETATPTPSPVSYLSCEFPETDEDGNPLDPWVINLSINTETNQIVQTYAVSERSVKASGFFKRDSIGWKMPQEELSEHAVMMPQYEINRQDLSITQMLAIDLVDTSLRDETTRREIFSEGQCQKVEAPETQI